MTSLLLLPDLSLGSSGPLVGNWQRFLIDQDVRPPNGRLLTADEAFGPITEAATGAWQAGQGLLASGVVANVERRLALSLGFIPFIEARNKTVLYPKKRSIDLLVIHDMEYPERPDSAEWCAGFFASSLAPQASAHYCVDSGLVIQCVRDEDVAWHAPGANKNGIGIEHAGYAKQTREEWSDAYSQQELERSAVLVARLAAQYGIPIDRPSVEELKRGARGIVGHIDATQAFRAGKGHTDPGPNFPWEWYLERVRSS